MPDMLFIIVIIKLSLSFKKDIISINIKESSSMAATTKVNPRPHIISNIDLEDRHTASKYKVLSFGSY